MDNITVVVEDYPQEITVQVVSDGITIDQANQIAANTEKVSDINHVTLELFNVDNTSDLDKPVSNATNQVLSAETQARTYADDLLQVNVNSEASTRLANDNTIQSNLDTEVSTRIDNDNTLQANIDAETALRTSADTLLQGNIDTESSDRISADNALNASIGSEATTRLNADNLLQGNIDSLDVRVSLNDVKVGITTQQASDITTNNDKVSFDSISSIRLADTSGINTGDQDLSGYQLISEKDTASGYVGLDADGKINPLQLPAVAITETFVVNSEAEMLAIAGQTGDVAVRTDISKSFILTADDPTVLANWQDLISPTSPVSSVFGRTGAVTAQNGDYTKAQVGLSNVPNIDFTDAVGLNTDKISFDNTSSTRLANTSGTNTGDQDLSGYLLNTTDTFNGILTVSSFGGNILVIQDSNSIGSASNPKMSFNDSEGTIQGYVGMGSGVNSKLYLHGIDGIQINNQLEVSGLVSASGTVTGSNLSGTNTGDQDLSGYSTISGSDGKYLLNTTDTFTGDLTVAGSVLLNTGGARLRLQRTGASNYIDYNNAQNLTFRSISATDTNATNAVVFTPAGAATFASSVSATDGLFSNSIVLKREDPILLIQDSSTSGTSANATLRLGESGAAGVLDSYWDIKQAPDNLGTHLEINHHSNGNALSIAASGAATFASSVTTTRLITGTSNTSISTESDIMRFINSNPNNTGGFSFFTSTTAGGFVNALRILGTGDATFAQSVSAIDGNFSGSVGIGTNSPNALLDVSSLEPRLRLTSTRTGVSSGQTAGAIDFYTSDGSSEGNSVNAKIEAYSDDIYGNLGLKFFTGGSTNQIESLRIDNNGNSTFASTVTAKDSILINHTPSTTNFENATATFELTGNNYYSFYGAATSHWKQSILDINPSVGAGNYTFSENSNGGGYVNVLEINKSNGLRQLLGNITAVNGSLVAASGLTIGGSQVISANREGRFGNGTAAIPSVSFSSDNNTGMFRASTDALGFSTAGSERLRISNVGKIGVGVGFNYYSASTGFDPTNYWHIGINGNSNQFYQNGSYQGNIYLMGSDYRIKQDINNIEDGAIDRVKKLRTVTYRNKNFRGINFDESVVREGFIAHELQEVIPSAVVYDKDHEKFIQQLRIDSVVAVLTKAIQEQQDMIEKLEQRILTLENK